MPIPPAQKWNSDRPINLIASNKILANWFLSPLSEIPLINARSSPSLNSLLWTVWRRCLENTSTRINLQQCPFDSCPLWALYRWLDSSGPSIVITGKSSKKIRPSFRDSNADEANEMSHRWEICCPNETSTSFFLVNERLLDHSIKFRADLPYILLVIRIITAFVFVLPGRWRLKLSLFDIEPRASQ